MGFVAEQLLIRAGLNEFAHPVPPFRPDTHLYNEPQIFFAQVSFV